MLVLIEEQGGERYAPQSGKSINKLE